jgi:predicted nucleic acid-binding protein
VAQPLTAFQGPAIYVDAVLLAALIDPQSPWHTASLTFFRRAVSPPRTIQLITATLTIDEVVFVALQELLLRPPYGVTRSRSQYLAAHPAVVRTLMQGIDMSLQAVLGAIEIEPVVPEDITAMRQEMLASGTLPRDAIHVAVMRRLGITAIASDDEGFERCAGVTVYKP